MLPPSQIGFQSKWRQKRGAFGIDNGTLPMVPRSIAADNPKSRAKLIALTRQVGWIARSVYSVTG